MLKNSRYLIFIRRLKNVKIYLIHVSILLVSIGILKGVELVVILSQFNFQTLTTFVYQYTTDVQINLVSLFTLSFFVATVIPFGSEAYLASLIILKKHNMFLAKNMFIRKTKVVFISQIFVSF